MKNKDGMSDGSLRQLNGLGSKRKQDCKIFRISESINHLCTELALLQQFLG
jgi:hypothetical protein